MRRGKKSVVSVYLGVVVEIPSTSNANDTDNSSITSAQPTSADKLKLSSYITTTAAAAAATTKPATSTTNNHISQVNNHTGTFLIDICRMRSLG